MTPPATAAPQRAAFIFIFITIALDMLALGVVLPVLPKLVERFVAGDTAQASEILGVFGTAWALMQFICSPLQGALSDRFGRRPLVLISNFGLGLDYVLMAVAPNLILLFVGRVISGMTSASVATAYAYVADVTPQEKRAGRFGLLGAAFGLGFVVGPAVGGMLGVIDPRLPFWAAAIASLLNGVYGLFILPESLPPERRMAWSWRRANPLGSLRLLRSHHELLRLATVTFLSNLAHEVLPSTAVLYMSYRYGWDERQVGLVLAAVGICAIVVQAGLTGPAVRRLGERRALLVGLLFGAIGFVIYGLASTGIAFCVGIPVMALWGLASPAALGLMSKHVGPSEQGQLQGANASIQGIANLIGPGMFTLLFAYAIGAGSGFGLPGAPFLLAALLIIGAVAVSFTATRQRSA